MASFDRHVAEERNFFAIIAAQAAFGATDQNVGLNADLAQLPHGVLRGLGLQFAGRLQIRHQRQMNIQAVALADVERELANGFHKRLALNIANGATDFGDYHIDVVSARFVDHALDFVSDMRNHLHGLTEELAAPFLIDHRLVDLPSRIIRIARQRAVREAS